MPRAYTKKPSNPHGAGRKPTLPTPEQCRQVEQLIGLRLSHREIALVMGHHRDWLAKYFKEELAVGLLKRNIIVKQNIFKLTATNFNAAKYWLENCDRNPDGSARWFDSRRIEANINAHVSVRPDLSSLSDDQLAQLRQASNLIRSLTGPVIEGESRQIDAEEEEGSDE